jgi:subtilisin family serine protease
MIDPKSGRAFGVSTSSGDTAPAETTGRYIVEFTNNAGPEDMVYALRDAGLSNVATSRDFAYQGVLPDQTAGADATVLTEIRFAVTDDDPTRIDGLRAFSETDDRIISVTPEYVQSIRSTETPVRSQVFEDTADVTWGLIATESDTSPYTGNGIRLAVLDTGFATNHPDFAGRPIAAHSFISGETPEDGHGHGTHCVGTSSGGPTPTAGPRYGIAGGVSIYVGKVLGNSGSGSDGTVLAGINWALANGVDVVSMSLGANVAEASEPYTTAGRRALERGTLIVAAAGNNANRPNGFGFVGSPANSPYVMAVGALEPSLKTAPFSARSGPGRGNQVDVAGPGFKVYSSWILPDTYKIISGTSMATPHVSGVAALWAEATGLRGRDLWSVLVQEAQRLYEPSVDVGSGLVHAPQQ